MHHEYPNYFSVDTSMYNSSLIVIAIDLGDTIEEAIQKGYRNLSLDITRFPNLNRLIMSGIPIDKLETMKLYLTDDHKEKRESFVLHMGSSCDLPIIIKSGNYNKFLIKIAGNETSVVAIQEKVMMNELYSSNPKVNLSILNHIYKVYTNTNKLHLFGKIHHYINPNIKSEISRCLGHMIKVEYGVTPNTYICGNKAVANIEGKLSYIDIEGHDISDELCTMVI